MTRFVILEHDHPRGTHWDFMIQSGDSLLTWALPERPSGRIVMDVVRLPDHRIDYLDYEGPVSKGRGSVTRCETGTCSLLKSDEECIELRLEGVQLKGGLVRLERKRKADETHWIFSWTPDEE